MVSVALFVLFLGVGVLGFGESVRAAVIFEEDFENWTGQQTPGNSYNDLNFGICPNTGRSSVYVHNGNYSLAGCVGGTESGMYLRDTVVEQPASIWVWLTFWAYFPSDFTPVKATDGRTHLPGMEYGSHYMQIDMYTGSNARVCVTTWNDKRNPLDTPITYESLQGDWHKIQLGYQYSSKSYECWIDESHKHSGIADDLSGFETTDTIMIRVQKIRDYDNQGYWYLDDVSVATGDRPTETDTTPPTRSNPQPTGELSSGTTQTTISLDTNETATCKYSETPNTSYNDMTLQLSSGQDNTHTATISNLSDGNSYTYYARCQDESNNQNTDDFTISFSIASPSTIYTITNFINLVTNWLTSGSGLESDVNNDGVVNTRDLGIMLVRR